MKNFIIFTLAACSLFALSACKSVNSVELFRVNENGEIVNIGRGADADHVIYGHFRDASRYDRAFVTIQDGSSTDHTAICYIKVNDGQTNDGPGEGIRMEPCNDAILLNEGPVLGTLDGIGVFDRTQSPWGVYQLFVYRGTAFVPVIKRPINIEHWQSGLDAVRLNPEDNSQIILNYSHQAADGTISILTQTVSVADIESGTALNEPVIEEIPANSAAGPTAEAPANDETQPVPVPEPPSGDAAPETPPEVTDTAIH